MNFKIKIEEPATVLTVNVGVFGQVVVEARRVGRGGGDAGDPVDLGPI
jgi:hypothetical protein